MTNTQGEEKLVGCENCGCNDFSNLLGAHLRIPMAGSDQQWNCIEEVDLVEKSQCLKCGMECKWTDFDYPSFD